MRDFLVNHKASNVDTAGKSLKTQCFRFKVCWRDSCWSWWWGFFQDLAQHIWLSTFVVCYYGFTWKAGLLKASSQHWWGGLVHHIEARRFVTHLWVGMLPLLAWRFQCKFRGSSTSWRRLKDLVLVQHTWTADSKFTLCVLFFVHPIYIHLPAAATCGCTFQHRCCCNHCQLVTKNPYLWCFFSACQLPWGVTLMFVQHDVGISVSICFDRF